MLEGFPIDGKRLGTVMVVGCRPALEYNGKVPTGKVLGTRFRVLLPALMYLELYVVVPQEIDMDLSSGQPVYATLEGLVVKAYFSKKTNALAFSAQADAIHVVNATAKA